MYGELYLHAVLDCITRVWETQHGSLQKAAQQICDAIKEKRNIFIFGCSHAGILAEEVFYRTGGLAVINPIMFPGFMLNTRPVTLTSQLERLPGLGRTILTQSAAHAGDVLILHSVSGRNTVPVEMAQEAKKQGIHTICITNLEYSRSVTSRSPDDKRLFEVCDTVIDNCGAVGDAAVKLEGLPEKIGATSTSVGAALLNAIIVEAVELLIAEGVVPPVFLSANLNGGDAHNARIFEEYKDNIFYM